MKNKNNAETNAPIQAVEDEDAELRKEGMPPKKSAGFLWLFPKVADKTVRGRISRISIRDYEDGGSDYMVLFEGEQEIRRLRIAEGDRHCAPFRGGYGARIDLELRMSSQGDEIEFLTERGADTWIWDFRNLSLNARQSGGQ